MDKPIVTSRVKHLLPAAVILNLLIPGAGHLFAKELLFGLFVFLVMLIAVALFFVSVLVELPALAKWALLGLPMLFYAFSFVDLANTIRSGRKTIARTSKAFLWFVLAGLAYQVLSPSAPINFSLNNLPEIFTQPDSRLTPLYRRGDLLKASSLAYFVNVALLKRPILHRLPDRFELLRFRTPDDKRQVGVVVGLPNENVEIVGGEVIANGVPEFGGVPGIKLSGTWPVTTTENYSILVATVDLGAIDHVYQVPLGNVIGKVGRLF